MGKIECYFYPTTADLENSPLMEYLSQVMEQDQERIIPILRSKSEIVVPFSKRSKALDFVRRVAELGGFACYGPMDDNYRMKFESYREKFHLSWGWLPFLFQGFWYLFKGMWQKAILYTVLTILLMNIPIIDIFIGVLSFIYFGIIGRYDYYLKKCRGEIFWPKFPYRKWKWPVWILIAAFIGFGTYNFTQKAVSFKRNAQYMFQQKTQLKTGQPFIGEDFSFDYILLEWLTFRHPPKNFQLTITRQEEPGWSETITMGPYKKLEMLAIVQHPQEAVPEMGLLGVVVKDPPASKPYEDLMHPDLKKTAEELTGKAKMPFYLRWLNLFDYEADPAEIHELNGRKWAHLGALLKIQIFGAEAYFITDSYWTLINGKAVYAVTHAFESTQDIMHAHAHLFIKGFSPGKTPVLPDKEMTISASSLWSANKTEEPAEKPAEKPVVVPAAETPTKLVVGQHYKLKHINGQKIEGTIIKKNKTGFWIEIERGANVYFSYNEIS